MAQINHPLLGNVTIAIRTNPRFKLVIRRPAPWDKRNPGYRSQIEARPHLNTVTKAFAEAGRISGGIPLRQRKSLIRDALKGQSFGGVRRVLRAPISDTEYQNKLAQIKAAVERIRGGTV